MFVRVAICVCGAGLLSIVINNVVFLRLHLSYQVIIMLGHHGADVVMHHHTT
jgi:hypothetical protein